jgi:hypothetical protein
MFRRKILPLSSGSTCRLILVGFLLGLLFDYEDRDSVRPRWQWLRSPRLYFTANTVTKWILKVSSVWVQVFSGVKCYDCEEQKMFQEFQCTSPCMGLQIRVIVVYLWLLKNRNYILSWKWKNRGRFYILSYNIKTINKVHSSDNMNKSGKILAFPTRSELLYVWKENIHS